MKWLYYWLTYGNFWIAFGAVGLTFCNSKMIYGCVNNDALLLSFFITLGAYNFQRILKANQLNLSDQKHRWLHSNQKMLSFITIICIVFSCSILISISSKKLLYFLPFLLVVTFYRLPFFGLSFRNIPGLKIFLISISWGFVTVLIPDLFSESFYIPSWKFIITSGFYVLAITIPFDVRDMLVDDSSKKTIPQIIGIRFAVCLAIFILLMLSIIFWLFQDQLEMACYCIFSAIILIFSFEIRPDWYYSFILDGLLVLMPVLFIF